MLPISTFVLDRVYLTPLGWEHEEGMFIMWSTPEVCQYSGEAKDFDGALIHLPARTAADSNKIIDFFVRSAVEGTRFRWAVQLLGSDEFVGTLGFNSLGACSELAYHARQYLWGQGLMTEACNAALNWLRQKQTLAEVEAFIDPANTRSARLAIRLGFIPTGESHEGADRYALHLRD